MLGCGGSGNEQNFCDFAVRVALAEKAQHFAFTPGNAKPVCSWRSGIMANASEDILRLGDGRGHRDGRTAFPGGGEGALPEALLRSSYQALLSSPYVGAVLNPQDFVLCPTCTKECRPALPISELAGDGGGSFNTPCHIPVVIGIERELQRLQIGGRGLRQIARLQRSPAL